MILIFSLQKASLGFRRLDLPAGLTTNEHELTQRRRDTKIRPEGFKTLWCLCALAFHLQCQRTRRVFNASHHVEHGKYGEFIMIIGEMGR